MNRISHLFAVTAGAALFAGTPADFYGITITVDGTNPPLLLSEAVATAMATDDGPDIINITTDNLPTADGQIIISKPLVINGDADNNGTPCDLLYDMTTNAVAANPDLGYAGKRFFEIQATGDVEINNLRMRPNDQGPNPALANIFNYNGAVAIFKPVGASDVSNVTLTKVYISGSATSGGGYVNLETGNDIYSNRRWGGFNGATDANIALASALLISDLNGAGTLHTVLDHCQVGLSRGGAVSVLSDGLSTTQIKGGLFGHCGRDGLRLGGGTISVEGTAEDRVRIVRNTNITADNSHCIEVVNANTVVSSIAYVDAAGCLTSNGISVRGGVVNEISHFRVLGRMGATPTNEGFYANGGNILLVRDSTVNSADGNTNANPMHLANTYLSPIVFRDSIFTSNNLGILNLNLPAGATFNNCGVPTDGVVGESLATTPFGGTGGGTFTNSVSASPGYLLRLPDYDWGPTQGSGNPLNGVGNANVLRPSSAAYDTASSSGGKLTGGAGPAPAGISEWMLMEM